ncbi:MAG: bifunctional [glutamine synthetase] adenylyltransferase/[glutamine synthetase]-adenylyl-L-tyrosine phosphorylase [Pseudomonadota bacterium]
MDWQEKIDPTQFPDGLLSVAQFLHENSPYLSTLLARFEYQLEESSFETLDLAIAEELAAFERLPTDITLDELKSALRIAKSKLHLLIAIGDITGALSFEATVNALSDTADNALNAVLDWQLRDMHSRGLIELDSPEDPQKGSGIVVLGMGKLGAHELNYSSDIDIIVFFQQEAPALRFRDPSNAIDLLSKLVRQLVQIMQERTGDGYVFRTDVRLRPDPSAMPLAIPVDMALHYYEARGQNWERAAMIKARPVAGDIEAGRNFLEQLRPFIWRKYLDYAAIADVQSIKRQIHAHKGHGTITLHAHNVKLGRGGIREIEFFVQTQQLIAGGRAPILRKRGTREMLRTFANEGWIEPDVSQELDTAYVYLRRVEHAIQMLNDEQTHKVPEVGPQFEAVSKLLGHASSQDFSAQLVGTLKRVEAHFGLLFREGETLSALHGNLVFTGETADPDTVDTLADLGFSRPADMWHIVSGWHFGRYPAVQSERARERLTELTPALLEAFASAQKPDDALLLFDSFIRGLPAGVQLFSMLHANPNLLRLLTTIITSAPRLSSIISNRPSVFAGLLEPAFFDQNAPVEEVEDALTGMLFDADGYEAVLDRLRIFAAEQRFRIGTRLLTGNADALQTGHSLASVAQRTISIAAQEAAKEVAAKHGSFASGQFSIVALGRLGSREMTAGSDVDIITLYDGVDALEESDGAKPLAASTYYARLTQRIIAALSAPTAEGVLYEVDMRLRPSGNKGPLASSFDAFQRYQRNEAWTWEHQALTRARPIFGEAELMMKVRNCIDQVLNIERDVEKLKDDIVSMRQRLLREKPAYGPFDLKNIVGGLTDLEFLAQFMYLSSLRKLKLDGAGARDILSWLGDVVLGADETAELIAAHHDLNTVLHLSRLCTSSGLDPAQMPAGLVDIICQMLNEPSLAHVQERLTSRQMRVAEAFRTHVGDATV